MPQTENKTFRSNKRVGRHPYARKTTLRSFKKFSLHEKRFVPFLDLHKVSSNYQAKHKKIIRPNSRVRRQPYAWKTTL